MNEARKKTLSPWREALRPQREINYPKTARMVMGTSCLQILVALALAVLYFANVDLPTGVLVVLLLPVVILGNWLLMRSARVVLDFARQMDAIRQTMRGEAELNRLLRAQRHDFLNHLQVVYSLLQLDEHKEAEAYLHRVYADIEQVGSQLRTDNPAVNALLAAKAVQAEQRHIQLHFELRATLAALPLEDWELCRVLANLIDNAMDAAEHQPEPQVWVRLWQDVGGLFGEIANNGPAIPRDQFSAIFEPGYTTKGDKGSGMGLYITRSTLKMYNGTLSVDSDGNRTAFSLFVPTAPAAAAHDN